MTRRRQDWSPGAAGPVLRLADPDPHTATWEDFAACKEIGTDLFFPEVGEGLLPAKKICAACCVRPQCLDFALDNPEISKHGIWGGTSPNERRSLKKERAA